MLNNLELEIKTRVDYIQSAHINDPYSSKLRDEISKLLLNDEQQSISFMRNCDENILSEISFQLDRFAGKYPSEELSSFILSLMDKFPNNYSIKSDCQLAINIINEELLYLQQLKEVEK